MSGFSAQEIAARRDAVLTRIARAAERARRDPDEVSLLAVTKTHSAEVVRRAALSGMTLFGENRVAEGAGKIQALSAEFPSLEWRLIGPLQTNKAKPALEYFSVIESLDRERLATRLEGLLAAEDRQFPVLIELNLGGKRPSPARRPSRPRRWPPPRSPFLTSRSAASWRCRPSRRTPRERVPTSGG